MLASLILMGAAALPACSTPLFPKKADRTQYDRYDRIRQEHAAQYETDEFGRRRPNLRGRLSPNK